MWLGRRWEFHSVILHSVIGCSLTNLRVHIVTSSVRVNGQNDPSSPYSDLICKGQWSKLRFEVRPESEERGFQLHRFEDLKSVEDEGCRGRF